MKLTGLVSLVEHVPAFSQLIEDLQTRPSGPISLGLLRAATPVVLAALQHSLQRPVVILTTHSAHARQLAEYLKSWVSDPTTIHRYPEPDVLSYERMPWAVETRQQRLAALATLNLRGGAAETPSPIVIASIRAVSRKTLPPREFLLGIRTLKQGQTARLSNLLAHWYAFGYDPVQVVEEPGQYSQRGGIIDIFSPQADLPVRIELFGDMIDSIRTFDPATQRSLTRLDAVTLIPAREALPKFGPSAWQKFAALDISTCHSAAHTEFERDAETLEQSGLFHNIEFYIPYMYAQSSTLLDYLPDSGILVVDDLAQLEAKARDLSAQAEKLRRDMVTSGELPEGVTPTHLSWDDIAPTLQRSVSLVLGDSSRGESHPLGQTFGVSPRYGGQIKRILQEWSTQAMPLQREIVISRQVQRLAELLTDDGAPASLQQHIDTPPPPGTLTLVHGTLPEGWTLANTGNLSEPEIVLLTDAEVFGTSRPEPRRPKTRQSITPEAFFADVSPGDYVVHIEHGIGLFQGLVKLAVEPGGPEQEYLQINYAAGDRLYVPIHQVDRLSRYVGGGAEPPVYRLGTADWDRVKVKAKRAIEDIAEELLDLYAARQIIPGHAFSSDDAWQRELEASFPYVETQDQLEAIENVKKDMETAHPMDRLVTGDVGYGKTEVALRAAFKAVSDGTQVAILVPTTVLAQQHYQTFHERLNPFPVTVEMLSRFRSRKSQQEILKHLAEGHVDIVIGTHRLIQKDVHFKNLGLLIIDEEQRFGVAHKERLKQMRKEVDVLTLTATPIPRTLYMSLTGARDMSTIDTPPDERLPIKTRVAEYDDNLIRQAIVRELNRGGQVYFVHNRVHGIEQIAQRVQNLVPEAIVAIGHGQMREAELEKVMVEFAAGKVDVLVCTSIIESGLDIPNANTIIINRADRFGLAQLYQLRGRVGRSAVRAYAYLLYAPHQPLSEIATQRLEAIARASELGAGFQVSMYDLEIRGAGEFLGSRQHGHITAIGFDLYSRMLAQAIEKLKQAKSFPVQDDLATRDESPSAEPVREVQQFASVLLEPLERTVQVSLPIPAFLPEDYIGDAELRLKLYRRMARLRSEHDIVDMQQEMEDRFGPLPPEATQLMYQLRVKVLALEANVESIATDSGQIVIRFGQLSEADRLYISRMLSGKGRLGREQIWLPLDERGAWPDLLLEALGTLSAARSTHIV